MKTLMRQTPFQIIFVYILAQILPAVFLALAPTAYQTEVSVYGTMVTFTLGALLMIVLNRKSTIHNSLTETPSAPTRSIVIWGVVGMVLAILTQAIASIIEATILGIPTESANTEGILLIAQSYPLFMIIVSIMGPIMEEFVFRKVIFGLLYDVTGAIGAAVISGLLFAFIHFDSHILLYSSMGFVFCYLYTKTKSIWTPILAHALMNTVVLLVNFAS